MMKNIVIYQDEGVGAFGLSCLHDFFMGDNIHLADARDVIGGKIFNHADLFVMPGGADLPYARKLNGTGNANIRAFVENGGTYLGICAGAYYACRDIEFHKGRMDEICETRELAFVPATAIGSLPALAPHYDETLHSAAIVTVGGHGVFYYGGPYFTGHFDDCLFYDALQKPSIVMKNFGQGRVILSGVHIEVTADHLQNYPAKDATEKEKALSLAKTLGSSDKTNWKDILFKK